MFDLDHIERPFWPSEAPPSTSVAGEWSAPAPAPTAGAAQPAGPLSDLFGHFADEPAAAPSDAPAAFAPETHDSPTAKADTPAQGVEPADDLGDLIRGLSQEGAAGLDDLEGMMDRQRAQRDLADRFQVVPDDWKGHAHNQVTQKEYEELCRTYSDVRLGRGDLTLDTSDITDAGQAQRYRDSAMTNLADIMMTTSGRKQIMGMSDNASLDDAGAVRVDAAGNPIHHHTTIRPGFKPGATGHGEADYATGSDETNNTDPATLDDRYRGVDGQRGAGADATIWFSPEAKNARGPTDVNLAHELQHAMHTTQGTVARGEWHGYGRDAQPPPFGKGPVANAERQAVGLDFFGANSHDPVGCTENTYRQERNTLGIGDKLSFKHWYYPPGMFDDPDDF